MTRSRRLIAPGPTSPSSLRDALVADLSLTAAKLSRRRQLGALAVHDTRKRLKRARATLALIRSALSASDYQRCDRALREAGRSLAAARDATVMARTYAKIRDRASARPSRRSDPEVTGPIRNRRPADPAKARRLLQVAAARLERTAPSTRGWETLGVGLRKVYRGGRRRLPDLHDKPSSETLHAWRKHAKRWWHVLEVFEVVAPKRLTPDIADTKRLSALLGEEHDLALLSQRIQARRSGPIAGDDQMLETIDRRRGKLRRRALELGATVYAERPRDVERRMHDAWDRWRDDGAPYLDARRGRA